MDIVHEVKSIFVMVEPINYIGILNDSKIDLRDLRENCAKLERQLRDISVENYEQIPRLVHEFLDDVRQTYIRDNFSCASQLNASLECYVFHELHDVIAPLFYQACREEDDIIWRKCIKLQDYQFAHIFEGVNLPASIVELASLDSHKTVHDKMGCLSTCFDLIFAELKFAMVEVMAESQQREMQIPIVNNADVVPILVQVIMKAKCQHLYSNLYFIQALGDLHIRNKDCAHVITSFNSAIEALMEIQEERTFRKTNSEMDLKQFMTMMQQLNDFSINNSFQRLSLSRLSRQISKSHDSIGNF